MLTPKMNSIENELPDPSLVAQAAAEAFAPRVLEDYIEAIQTLRDKKFTFREIAQWLSEKFGIQADHNSVWRVYTRTMDIGEAHSEAEADEETEREEDMAEAERDGTLRVNSTKPDPTAGAPAQAPATLKAGKVALKKAKRKAGKGGRR